MLRIDEYELMEHEKLPELGMTIKYLQFQPCTTL